MSGIDKFFKNLTPRERALFESGIKLGAIFHQFIGTPVSLFSVDSLERTIEECVLNQFFVSDVSVRIDKEKLRQRCEKHGYAMLSSEMLEVLVIVKVENVKVISRLKYIEDLDYPLMYVEGIVEI